MERFLSFSKRFIFLFVFLLTFAPIAAFADSNDTELNYVSFGDSLAHSLLSNGKLGQGYVEYIVEDLTEFNYEVSSNPFGISGYQTVDVLEQLHTNDNEVLERIQEADLITLTIGANDVLGEIHWLLQSGDLLKFLDEAEVEALESEINKVAGEANGLIEQLDEDIVNAIEELAAITEQIESLKEAPSTEMMQLLNDALDQLTAANEIFPRDTVDVESLDIIIENISAAKQLIAEFNERFLENVNSNDGQSIEDLSNQLESFVDELDVILEDIEDTIASKQDLHELTELAQEVSQFLTKFQQSTLEILSTIGAVGTNIDEILQIIYEQNPEVEVFVMGYYNALPYLEEGVTIPLIEALNGAIKQTAESRGASYVPTFDYFIGKYDNYLDNQPDIHPNTEGYRALADAFMDQISAAFPELVIEDDDIDDPVDDPVDDETNGDENDDESIDNGGNGGTTTDNGKDDLTIRVDDSDTSTSDKSAEKSTKEILPMTATNYYQLIAIGSALLIIGITITIRRRAYLIRNL